jgi:branched-subunit amino acid ABC-type transport system permease component
MDIDLLLDTISQASVVMLAALGLALIFGLMGVVNLAHPGLMAIGAYTALQLQSIGIGTWLGVVAAIVLTGVVGLVIERLIMRRLYRRPLDTILATWGLVLITTQILTLLFGRAPKPFDPPVSGTVDLGVFDYSAYRLLLLVFAVGLWGALIVISRRTQLGLKARAVMANEQLAQALGINTNRVRQATFALGAALAGLAGALIGPLATVSPNYGVDILITAFLVVLLAGRSLLGLGLATVVIAACGSTFERFGNATFSVAVVVLVAVLLLRIAPDGFWRLRRFA